MASSDRHWPSMFRSKPCTNHHPWQHDSGPFYHRSPLPPGSEERSPDPKPRWSPRPEQIRILEAIFNSGMVNPPRDEIRRIRVRLEEYGQVRDANVFYWFQNRKSRSKNRQRHLHTATRFQCPLPPKPVAAVTPMSSSPTSSEHLTGPDKSTLPNPSHLHGAGPVMRLGSGGDSSVCRCQPECSCLSENPNIATLAAVPEHELWRELLGGADDGRKYFKMQLYHHYAAAAGLPAALSCVNASASFDDPASVIQELRTAGGSRGSEETAPDQSGTAAGANSTVFAGEMALEMAAGRALLADEGNFNVLPLQHGVYYLV